MGTQTRACNGKIKNFPILSLQQKHFFGRGWYLPFFLWHAVWEKQGGMNGYLATVQEYGLMIVKVSHWDRTVLLSDNSAMTDSVTYWNVFVSVIDWTWQKDEHYEIMGNENSLSDMLNRGWVIVTQLVDPHYLTEIFGPVCPGIWLKTESRNWNLVSPM